MRQMTEYRIGDRTEVVPIIVKREDVFAFVKALGDNQQIFYDVEAAKTAGFNDILLPLTYPTIFWQSIPIPWLDNQTIVQVDQAFHYQRPLTANTEYDCYIELKNIQKLRNHIFLKHCLFISDCARSETTVMIQGEEGL